MKHTNGPWSVGHSRKQMYGPLERWETPVHVGAFENRGNAIAIVYNGDGGAIHADRASVEANAHLIAAAPDLYEALKALLALPVAEQAFARLDKGIGTATPEKAWLEARAALSRLTTPPEEKA